MNTHAEEIENVRESLVVDGIDARRVVDADASSMFDLARFDYLYATKDDGTPVVLSYDGGAEWVVCEYAESDPAQIADAEPTACHLCDLDTDTPADLFARVVLGDDAPEARALVVGKSYAAADIFEMFGGRPDETGINAAGVMFLGMDDADEEQ